MRVFAKRKKPLLFPGFKKASTLSFPNIVGSRPKPSEEGLHTSSACDLSASTINSSMPVAPTPNRLVPSTLFSEVSLIFRASSRQDRGLVTYPFTIHRPMSIPNCNGVVESEPSPHCDVVLVATARQSCKHVELDTSQFCTVSTNIY